MGSQASFSFSSRASRSVPPVVAPCKKISPRDAPRDNPPKMQASSGSMGSHSRRGVSRSMNTEDTNMAYSDDTSSRPPMNFQPRMNSGTFSTMTVTPMGKAGIR